MAQDEETVSASVILMRSVTGKGSKTGEPLVLNSNKTMPSAMTIMASEPLSYAVVLR